MEFQDTVDIHPISSRSPDRGRFIFVHGGVHADTFKHCDVDTDGMEFVLLSYSERTGFTGIASARKQTQGLHFGLSEQVRVARGEEVDRLVSVTHRTPRAS